MTYTVTARRMDGNEIQLPGITIPQPGIPTVIAYAKYLAETQNLVFMDAVPTSVNSSVGGKVVSSRTEYGSGLGRDWSMLTPQQQTDMLNSGGSFTAESGYAELLATSGEYEATPIVDANTGNTVYLSPVAAGLIPAQPDPIVPNLSTAVSLVVAANNGSTPAAKQVATAIKSGGTQATLIEHATAMVKPKVDTVAKNTNASQTPQTQPVTPTKIYRFILATPDANFPNGYRYDTGANYPGCSQTNPSACKPAQYPTYQAAYNAAIAAGEIPVKVDNAQQVWDIIAGKIPVPSQIDFTTVALGVAALWLLTSGR